MSEINNKRPPTAKDREILTYLQKGQSLTHIDILNIFESTCSRDHIYRLRKAGYPIEWEDVLKKDEKGKVLKKWRRYYIKFQPELPQNAPRTDKEAQGAAKKDKTIGDAKKQNEAGNKPKFIEQELFK